VWRGVVASELPGRLQQRRVMRGKAGERDVPRVGGWQRYR
jgi:hypothetical protein